MADRDLDHLHPWALMVYRAYERRAIAAGLRPYLQETWRDRAAQLAAWRIGRDEHDNIIGKVVTRARPGSSWHNLERWDLVCGVWKRVPASFAWHWYLPPASGAPGLAGIGKNELTDADKANYLKLAQIAKEAPVLPTRWGGDFDGDGKPFEKGEWDLGHQEARPPGTPLSHVIETLNIQGADLMLVHDPGLIA